MDWDDITDSFRAACETLTVGELCHHQLFSLTEAMCAIELMDPKMDLSVQIKRPVLNVSTAISDGTMQLKKIGFSEMLGIMDETWAAFVTWLDGENLVETVFINMYLLRPTAIENPYLRAFAIGMVSFISTVRSKIVQASTYEEEDFCHLLPSSMTLEISETRVTGMLKEALEDLNRQIRFLKANKESVEVVAHAFIDSGESPDLLNAISVRLRLLRSLILTFQQFGRLIGDSGSGVDLHTTRQEVRKYLVSVTDLLDQVASSLDMGKPALEEGRTNPRLHPYGLMGFEAFANLAQMPPSIPRHAKIRGRRKSVEEMQNITKRLLTVLEIVSVEPTTDCHQIWAAIQRFGQVGVEGRSCLLSRSLLHILYLSPTSGRVMGRAVKQQVFLSGLRRFLAISDWGSVEKAMRSKDLQGPVEELIRACTDHLFDFPCTYAYNRSRQRNRITALVDSLWDLYEDSHRVDFALKELRGSTAVFTPYVAFFIFQLMWDFVSVGFELELYAAHEFPYVYFFLSETVLYYFLVQMTDLEQSQSRPAGKKGRRNGKEEARLTPLLTALKAHYHLASGTLTALCALQKDNKFRHSTRLTFGSEETRYRHRFAPLLNKGWLGDCGMYGRFLASWENRQSQASSKLYLEALRCFDAARARLQQDCEGPSPFHPAFKHLATTSHDENEALLKLARNNMVVMKILSTGAKADAEVQLDFNTARKHYPVLKLS